ncbi:MAG TPA: hypothetical protein VGJ22_12695 [Anaerolineales bacterium]|jgi:hypothetical protein
MLNSIRDFFTQRIKRGLVRRLNNQKIAGMARRVTQRAPEPRGRPVVFFKASTGIDDLSWNSGFHLLASWAFRLRGIPVVYFACNSGMSRCVLGTNRDDVNQAPPCASCVYQSRILYTDVPTFERANVSTSAVRWFAFDRDRALEQALSGLDLAALAQFTYHDLPLGELCLPGLRWILRRYNLDDDTNTRFLLREYILSAWNVAQKFSKFLDATDPRAVVVFNGQFFPEAVARFIAQGRGLRVITHEVGLQAASAFFTDGEATAYPIYIPDEFELSPAQDARLDEYLQKRFQGDFSMAGIQFWPEMRGLDEAFLANAARFGQIVPVFTNVIFDTSQPHANTVFPDMFGWLDMVLDIIPRHPETLFVIRAHPDETRTRKESRETVQGWGEANGVDKLDNVVFVAPGEQLSSYELIQRSKFVMVYNSTIGLEASILGVPVLCGGRARYTQYPTVFFPQTAQEYHDQAIEFLEAELIAIPDEFKRNARRFLYYQLFRTSLPFGDFLEPSVRTTQARLKSFETDDLLKAEAIGVITDGVLEGGDFLLKE